MPGRAPATRLSPGSRRRGGDEEQLTGFVTDHKVLTGQEDLAVTEAALLPLARPVRTSTHARIPSSMPYR